MPIIKSAIKKLRRDNKKRIENRAVLVTVRKSIKSVRTTPSQDTASKAFSLIDKAVKKGLIKKNTAARKKSQIAKVLSSAAQVTEKKAPKVKTVKKTSSKAIKTAPKSGK